MRVLIVEDEHEVAEELVRGLGDLGMDAMTAHAGRAALHSYSEADIVLLDLQLPDIDGFELCRAIRAASQVPIIIVSARDAEFDRVLGLKLGADDYVVKPYSLRELAARIEAVTRRAAGDCRAPDDEIRHAGPIRVDLYQRRVVAQEREVALTRKEFDLLALLAASPGKVLTRDFIMRKVWGHDGAGDTRTLGVHMTSLRKKLGEPRLIETVRGVGFRLVAS